MYTPRILGILSNFRKFFDPSTPSMRKGRDREKKTGGKKEKTDENSGHYVIASSRPPECRPLERRALVPKYLSFCHPVMIVRYFVLLLRFSIEGYAYIHFKISCFYVLLKSYHSKDVNIVQIFYIFYLL